MTIKKAHKASDSPSIISWSEHIGFDKTRDHFRTHIEKSSLPQVILVEGRAGLGKSRLLFMCAALHFCEEGTACGTCSSCLWIRSQEHPDVFVLDSEDKLIKIEEIREAVRHLDHHPSSHIGKNGKQATGKRVLCIVDADRLTVQAMNYLLKTIEEPPPYAQIYLSTSHKQLLLKTLLSRCVHWHIQPPPKDDTFKRLKALGLTQDGEFDPHGKLANLITRCGSTPGGAIRLLEDKEGLEKTHEDLLKQLLESSSSGEVVSIAERIAKEKKWSLSDLISLIEYCLNDIYKSSFKTLQKTSLKTLSQRRSFMREIKLELKKRNIHFNTQLFCEKMGFLSLPS